MLDYDILALCFDSGNLVTAGARGFFTLSVSLPSISIPLLPSFPCRIDLDTSQVLWSLQAHKERDIECVHFRNGQKTFITGGWLAHLGSLLCFLLFNVSVFFLRDGTVQGWDIEEARNLFKIRKAHSKGQEGGYVASVKWAPSSVPPPPLSCPLLMAYRVISFLLSR